MQACEVEQSERQGREQFLMEIENEPRVSPGGGRSATSTQAAARGSLKWIRRATAEHWPSLEDPILARLPGGPTRVEWVSPIAADGFAEPRDAAFLARLGRSDLAGSLAAFWPHQGPQWDALGRTDKGDLLLVEAKGNVAEFCSSACAAGPRSLKRIEQRLDDLAVKLGAAERRAPWTMFFYQLANRLAHLDFLRSEGVAAYLVLVNFLNDPDTKGPPNVEGWHAAYRVAHHVMGLSQSHPLSPYVVEIFPDVSAEHPGHARGS